MKWNDLIGVCNVYFKFCLRVISIIWFVIFLYQKGIHTNYNTYSCTIQYFINHLFREKRCKKLSHLVSCTILSKISFFYFSQFIANTLCFHIKLFLISFKKSQINNFLSLKIVYQFTYNHLRLSKKFHIFIQSE